jgi:nucleoside-diphosphate-sugar epimerase
MNVAVTGGSGFVGRHVLAALERRGVSAAVVTRSGALATAAHRPVVFDLSQPPADAFDRLGRPEVLIHLAWGGLPNYRSLHHFERELPAQYAFIGGLIGSGIRHVTAVGTCFEYGMRSGPLSENLPPHPANPYGFAKDALRAQLEYLRSSSPFSFSWGRLFYLYGEGQAASSILPQLRDAVARGDRQFNMSAGDQLRDYLPVESAADMLVELALRSADIGIVNICSGKPVSVRSMVERWIREHGWSIDLNLGHYPYPDYEPMAFWGDRSKLDRFLGSP